MHTGGGGIKVAPPTKNFTTPLYPPTPHTEIWQKYHGPSPWIFKASYPNGLRIVKIKSSLEFKNYSNIKTVKSEDAHKTMITLTIHAGIFKNSHDYQPIYVAIS